MDVKRESFTTISEGIGRADYSANVEQSVEPIILSWQNEYRYYEVLPLILPGATLQREITLDRNVVAILYDFFLSDINNQDYSVLLELWTAAGAYSEFGSKTAPQTVEFHFAKGVPNFTKYRITIANRGLLGATPTLSIHGMWTEQTTWYAQRIPT